MTNIIKYFTKLFFVTAVLLGFNSVVSALEINSNGVTGTLNTTVTSGVSVRTGDIDCNLVNGTTYSDSRMTDTGHQESVAGTRHASYNSGSGKGCAKRRTDGYGNVGKTSSGGNNIVGANGDDGNMNYSNGSIVDATNRIFTSFSGETGGVGVNLSLVGSYNPVNQFNDPEYKAFTPNAKENIRSDFDILDAYLNFDVGTANITAGQFVTNWGEATFIPIGFNGLVTNALDLNKLRVPGSSIREALVPAKQVTVNFMEGDWSIDAYVQFGESHIALPEAGTFWGSEVASGDRLSIAGARGKENGTASTACDYWALYSQHGAGVVGTNPDSHICNATVVANHNTLRPLTSTASLLADGLNAAFGNTATRSAIASVAASLGSGATATFGGQAGDVLSAAADTGKLLAAAEHFGTTEDMLEGVGEIGAVTARGVGHTFADGEGQFGFAARTYLADIGTGVDIGLYYANYDSKVPYFRGIGRGGNTAGDALGMYTLAATFDIATQTFSDGSADSRAGGLGGQEYIAAYSGGLAWTDLSAAEIAGWSKIKQAIGNITYNEGICASYLKNQAAGMFYNGSFADSAATEYQGSAWTSEQQAVALKYFLTTEIDGVSYHDAGKCAYYAAAWGRTATLAAAGAGLGAATNPLGNIQYEFIYPENNEIMGASFNTNVGSTMVNGEVTYRPSFPLATRVDDQLLQLADANGANALLGLLTFQGIYADATLAAAAGAYLYPNCGGASTDCTALFKDFERSSLPRISQATVYAGDYYSTPWLEYDVVTINLGTTTSFTASAPITVGLGADNTVLVSELGIVHVRDLDDTRGFLNRGGYVEGVGGDKCKGIAGTSSGAIGAASALAAVTNIGASQTDPLFGNGGYCEDKNTIDDTSMTYRLVGAATYNNAFNSAWSITPNFAWAHDFSGYGSTSLGGFVPGKMALSVGVGASLGSALSMSATWVNQMGDVENNTSADKDYLTASISYAF